MDRDVSNGPAHTKDLISAYCRRCGYSLRGLPEHGDCPECGRSIRSSLLAPPDLTRLPGQWLRLTHVGLWTATGGWLGLLCPFLVEALRFWCGLGALPGAGISGWSLVVSLVFYASLLVTIVGFWMATPYHPVLRSFGLMEEFGGSARFFLIAGSALLLGGVATQEPFLFVGGAIAGFVGLSLATKWCCDLAGRAPIELPAPGAAIPWMPIVAVILNVFAVSSGNAGMRILGQLAIGTAWLTTAYALFRAIGAVNQSLRLLRDRPI